MRLRLALAALLSVSLAGAAHAQDDALQRAMRDELARSTRLLRLDTLPRPYFIAYRVDETQVRLAAAARGSLVASAEGKSRLLIVEVRVGDYAFDNTNYIGGPGMGVPPGVGGMSALTTDDDYGAIRRALWLATDAAYKAAVEQLSRKRAALQNETRSDSLADFSREEPRSTEDSAPLPAVPRRGELDSLALRLSALFRDVPAIQHSRVECRVSSVRSRYLNSEGTSFTRWEPRATVTVAASTQATDGVMLSDGFQVYARSWAALLPAESLTARAMALGARLARLREAPVAAAYNGPVLFEGQAAAEVFGQIFVPRLAATRRPISDNLVTARMMEQRENPFLDEIGARVLARSLSVTVDPTLAEVEGHATGGFRVDDDGLPTRATLIVEHGILRTLIASRTPVRGILHSTGNRRGSAWAGGTVLMGTDSGLGEDALRKRLLDLAAARGSPYGLVVRRIANAASLRTGDPMAFLAGMAAGPQAAGLAATDAVKLFPDGHEEPVRGASIGNLTLEAFKDIVAASAARTVHTTTDIGPIALTYVVPALLFEDVAVRPPRGETPKLPILPPPWMQ